MMNAVQHRGKGEGRDLVTAAYKEAGRAIRTARRGHCALAEYTTMEGTVKVGGGYRC